MLICGSTPGNNYIPFLYCSIACMMVRPPPAPLTCAGLNMAVFLLIGKTSALTMNIAGVVKDWMLIGLSVWIYKWVAARCACSLVF